MERRLTLQTLRDYIPDKNDKATKYRPDCFYVPRPPARRKYETAIRPPDRNFFKLMANREVYLWIVVKKYARSDKEMYQKISECFKCVKTLIGYEKLPICQNYDECFGWIKDFPSQIVLFEDIFNEVFPLLSKQQNACGFHVISSENVEIARAARQNRKIKNIYDDQSFIFKVVKQNMERLAISKEQQSIAQKANVTNLQEQRYYLRNVIFPNFIKLSKYDKSEHNQYRLHLIGLRKLTNDDKLASKDKFIEYSRDKFPTDEQLIQQYYTNNFQNPKDVLRFYTLDSFFYRVLNNTLRIAKNTEEFFSIGQPFNRVFDAIKSEYDKSQKNPNFVVFRGADLTNSQCQYLEENIGNYIEINGFISTSKSIQTAKNFARDRKNNTIFKIVFKPIPPKYKQYDYGYVDLQANKCSAFDQDEVLLNALNVFKILGKEKIQNFDLYVLEYGSIFQILQQDANTLSENDRFAYFSFRQLKEMNEQVKDIGEVYLRTYEPQKAIQIYEFKLEKMKQSIDVVKREDIDQILVKAADAYLANGQPDKALKYYQSTFLNKKKNKLQKRKSVTTQITPNKQEAASMISISTKVTTIQNSIDQYEKAEQNYKQTAKQIDIGLKQEWNMDVLWSKIDLQWQVTQGKKFQMLYEEQYSSMKQIEAQLLDALKKTKGNKNEVYEHKKIKMKLTEVYEVMAQTTSHSQTQKTRIQSIRKSFDDVYSQLLQVIEKKSYEEGVLNVRKSEIMRRTKDFDEGKQLQNYQKSVKMIKRNTLETDEILPKVYNSLAELHTKIQKKGDINEAITAYKKQLKIQTIIYSQSDPKPLNTRMNIAICQRDDKNTVEALQQFSEAYHTKLYKKDTKYSQHAKILFNMAQAYTDKGEDGLALKSLKQAYSILEKQLSENDFDKSVLRFKIKLRIGRIYTSSSLRTPQTLKLAERNLLEYHKFIKDFYDHPHTDVAMSYNCLGALYSIIRKFQQSRQNFILSIDVYCETSGSQSLQVAKIKSNLAICYAQLKSISKATKVLLESQQIFGKVYGNLKKHNPFEYESKFIQAEIQTLSKEYEKAIQSCEESIQAQKLFLQSKKRCQMPVFLKSDFPLRREQADLKVQMNSPQYKSGITKLIDQSPQQSEIFQLKQKNEIPYMNSMISYMTEHGFKCEFQICECLIYLKQYKKAKKRLQSLRENLIDRIKRQSVNPLFKDTLHSKKLLYLNKSEDYIVKVTKAIEKKEKKDNLSGKNQQSNSPNKDALKNQQIQNDPVMDML